MALTRQALMNSCLGRPHDPFLPLTPRHWSVHTELLLRAGVATLDPSERRIALTAFHL